MVVITAILRDWKAIFDAQHSVGVNIKQRYQRKQESRPEGLTAYVFLVHNKRYGWQTSTSVTRAAAGFDQVESQLMESRFQVSAQRSRAAPGTIVEASDIVDSIALYLNSQTVIDRLQAAGIGIYRISDIQLPRFIDDDDEFEIDPMIDFTLSYTNTMTLSTPQLAAFVGNINRV